MKPKIEQKKPEPRIQIKVPFIDAVSKLEVSDEIRKMFVKACK